VYINQLDLHSQLASSKRKTNWFAPTDTTIKQNEKNAKIEVVQVRTKGMSKKSTYKRYSSRYGSRPADARIIFVHGLNQGAQRHSVALASVQGCIHVSGAGGGPWHGRWPVGQPALVIASWYNYI
jgi:hypothetical protein